MKKNHRSWNAGRKPGKKKPFTYDQIQRLTRMLEEEKEFRQLALFCLGIDSCLRGGDLVRLRVHDLMDSENTPKTEIRVIQQKTGSPVTAAITPYTQSAINCFVADADLAQHDFLFTGRTASTGNPITTNYLRRLVKQWAVRLNLDSANYSSHSLRRTKAAYLYSRGVRPEMLRFLLGHQSLKSTQEYLGIDRSHALELARKFDCFGE